MADGSTFPHAIVSFVASFKSPTDRRIETMQLSMMNVCVIFFFSYLFGIADAATMDQSEGKIP